MNSVLQALFATKQLRDFVLNSCEPGGPLFSGISYECNSTLNYLIMFMASAALLRLFKEMSSSVRAGYTNPSSFRSTFIQYESKFRGYE